MTMSMRMTTIRQGNTGDEVKVAQYLTKFAAAGKADGVFSADFVAHVCTWQRTHGLVPDGVIGPKTWKKMAEVAYTVSTSKNRKSRNVWAVQILLGRTVVDGIFGSKTKQAVAVFQTAVGIKSDGICSPATYLALIMNEVETTVEKPATSPVQPVDYKQGDSRWGKKMYSCYGNKKQTMANSGCGPTAMADVVATLKDSTIDPYDLAQLSVANGHRSRSGGTAWSFFPFIMKEFGFTEMIQTDSFATLQACLDNGGYVVCSMGPGYWTKGGHFICVWKVEGGYVYANDPASSKRKKQVKNDFIAQHKEYFCFRK